MYTSIIMHKCILHIINIYENMFASLLHLNSQFVDRMKNKILSISTNHDIANLFLNIIHNCLEPVKDKASFSNQISRFLCCRKIQLNLNYNFQIKHNHSVLVGFHSSVELLFGNVSSGYPI